MINFLSFRVPFKSGTETGSTGVWLVYRKGVS